MILDCALEPLRIQVALWVRRQESSERGLPVLCAALERRGGELERAYTGDARRGLLAKAARLDTNPVRWYNCHR